MNCPGCGQECVCKNCGYSEPDIWMKSHHDFETEVALADNVTEKMPELWGKLHVAITLRDVVVGSFVYKLTAPTPNAPSGRVVRISVAIYKARGNKFTRPKNYVQRRDSDKKSLAGWKSAHRILEVVPL